MVRTKTKPFKFSERQRAVTPTGWRASVGFWLNQRAGEDDEVRIDSWEKAEPFCPPCLGRACVQAVEHDDPSWCDANGRPPKSDSAYDELIEALLQGDAGARQQLPQNVPGSVLTDIGLFMLLTVFTWPTRDEVRCGAAAKLAGDALRRAQADGASWCTLHLACRLLQRLPPAIAVREHEVVAQLLTDGEPRIKALAAHTLACMGPEAVAEHYEEVVATAGFHMRVAGGARLGRSCAPAAWLCVSVLEPAHLLRLEARGAPVRALQHDARFAAAHEGLVPEGAWGVAFEAPEPRDVVCAVESAVLAPGGGGGGGGGAEALAGAVVQDAASQLAAFQPVALAWSARAHAAFPPPARARALELRVIGRLFARSRLALPAEVWEQTIMPAVVRRRSHPGGVGEAGKLRPLPFLRPAPDVKTS